MRHKAIKAGFILPPLYDKQMEAEKTKNPTLDYFVSGPVFSVDLPNMILVLWIVRHALPWIHFEDPAFRAAFYCANRSAVVRSTAWATKQSIKLFAGLHNKAINNLKVG